MNNWGTDREVEKPAPLRVRAATAATKLITQREHFVQVHGASESWLVAAMTEAIGVLEELATGKRPR